ncbi:MAG: hypothetical protein ABSA72_01180 [Nitrososphaerales archaeon]
MASPLTRRLSADSAEKNLANNDASDYIRLLLRRQMALSKRRGSWFRLSLQERSIINLSLVLKVKFRSITLLRAVVSVLKKLRDTGRTFNRGLLRGSRIARIFSEAAVSWGNQAARGWRSDRQYIAFLGNVFQS